MKAEEKTNVMRVLEQKKVPYKGHCYVDTDAVSGVEVAEVLGQDPAHVFKTLVTMGKTKQNYVFVIPVARELDLKKAANVSVVVNVQGYVKWMWMCAGIQTIRNAYVVEPA